ncbi:MAG: glycosyltransferase [Tunicatimonas sp.]
MKILTVIDSFHTGGKERRLIELLKGLTSAGIACELIVLSKVVTYPELYDLNVNIHFVERKWKKDPMVFGTLFRLIKTAKPDLIQSWSSMMSIYTLPIAKLLRIPFVNAIIVDAPQYVRPFSQSWLRTKLTFPFSDAVVANSHAGKKSYQAPAKKTIVIHNGFDFKRADKAASPEEVRESLGITTDKVVGMVGKFQPRKDYATYLKAAVRIVAQRSDVTFLAIGDGDLLEDCRRLVSQSANDRIIFTGRRTDVESVVSIFDVGVLMTNHRVHGEGISNALMEYMVMGKPVVASTGGGTAELVTDGEVGYLVPPGDEVVLTEKLSLLLDDPELARKLGDNAKQRIQHHFSLQRMTDEYIQLYQRLLHPKHS